MTQSSRLFEEYYPGENIFVIHSVTGKLKIIRDAAGFMVMNLYDRSNHARLLEICREDMYLLDDMTEDNTKSSYDLMMEGKQFILFSKLLKIIREIFEQEFFIINKHVYGVTGINIGKHLVNNLFQWCYFKELQNQYNIPDAVAL